MARTLPSAEVSTLQRSCSSTQRVMTRCLVPGPWVWSCRRGSGDASAEKASREGASHVAGLLKAAV